MSSPCCYTGSVPKDASTSHIRSASVLSCCGKFQDLTVNNLTVLGFADLPPTPPVIPYGVLNVSNFSPLPPAPQTLTNGNPPARIINATFAGVDISNPLAGESEFQIATDGRYEFQILVTGSAAAGGGFLSVFVDGVNAGQSLLSGIDTESAIGSAYPYLTAGQVVDVTLSWNGGTPVDLLYVAIKVQRVGSV